MWKKPFALCLINLLTLAASSLGAQDSLLPLVRVDNSESGLDHVVKIQTKTDKEGLKYPWQSPLADINGDGNLDIMYYGHHGGNAAIWFGKGDGSFTLDPDGYKARWIFGYRDPLWVDVNGDGAMDGITTEAPRMRGILAMNTGDGHFQNTKVNIYGTLLDLDLDGHHDDLWMGPKGAYSLSPSISEWGNKAPETVKKTKLWMPEDVIPWPEGVKKSKHPLAPNYHTAITADLDGDNKAELIVTFSKRMLSWVLKKGADKWEDQTGKIGLPASEKMWLLPDDVDVDGDLDLIDLLGGWWYANDGKGQFTKNENRIFDPKKRKRGGPWDGDGEYQVIDLDNNGYRDLTFGGDHSQKTGAFLNMGSGKFVEISNVNGSRRHRKFGDVDNDYDLDMVRCGKTAIYYRNDTTNTALKIKVIPQSWMENVLGCSVWVFEAGKMGDNNALIHYRQCIMLRSMKRSNVLDTVLHVGLGKAESADVRIRFPDGTVKEVAGVKAKTTVTFKQSNEDGK